jgi:hypothetical protein
VVYTLCVDSPLVRDLRTALEAAGMRVDYLSVKVQSVRMTERGPREPWIQVFLTVDGKEIDLFGHASTWPTPDHHVRALQYIYSRSPEHFLRADQYHLESVKAARLAKTDNPIESSRFQ